MANSAFFRVLLFPLLATGTRAIAADRMIGVVPTNGETMLIKQFVIEAGTVVTAVQFENNDVATIFPAITLVRGPLTSINEGVLVAMANNVQPGAGSVTVSWPSPVTVENTEAYYVSVRFPQGLGKQGLGLGPALGANDTDLPGGTYVAENAATEFEPVNLDLAMTLVVHASASPISKTGGPPGNPSAPQSRDSAGIFLKIQGLAVQGTVSISFGIEHASMVELVVFDVSGRRVRALQSGWLARGMYESRWDGLDARSELAPPGVYFARLRQASGFLTQKIVMTR